MVDYSVDDLFINVLCYIKIWFYLQNVVGLQICLMQCEINCLFYFYFFGKQIT